MPNLKVIADSGAYAAWKKGEPINIQDYIAFLKRHKDYIYECVNLDVIPGEPGRTPTKAEVDDSAKRSYENLQIMKGHGLRPIPVFHQGESFHWLQKYIDDGDDYIGISPAADMMGWRGPDPEVWLDKVFSFITDPKGVPLIRTHGFGITGAKYLRRYPWTTCDSTSWTRIANFGKIMVPIYSNGKPNYLSNPHYVHVSDFTTRVPDGFVSARDKAKDQFGNLGKLEQDQVIHFVTKECNLTMTAVRYCDNERRKSMIVYWSKVVATIGDVLTFKFKNKWSMR